MALCVTNVPEVFTLYSNLKMYFIVRPMVPENNVPCTYHCLHVLSILVEDS